MLSETDARVCPKIQPDFLHKGSALSIVLRSQDWSILQSYLVKNALSTILVAVPVASWCYTSASQAVPLFLPNPVDFRTEGSDNPIDRQYIVKFKDGIIGDIIKEFFQFFGSLTPYFVFDGLFSGFAVAIDAFTLGQIGVWR